MSNHRIGNLHLLCLEKLQKEEANKGNKVNTMNGKEISSCDKMNIFKMRNGFILERECESIFYSKYD